MTDLTLHEYRDLSEGALKRMLKIEALKIFSADTPAALRLADNGGRRSGTDRRQFSYISHIPERRCGQDRRSRVERRRIPGSKTSVARKGVKERRDAFK